MKKTFGILLVLLLLGAVFVVIFKIGLFPFGDQRKEKGVREDIFYRFINEEIRNEIYDDAFERIVEDDYFSFPIEKTVSFGDNKDLEKQIGKYEEVAKDKQAILMMEFKNANDQTREVYIKALELNDENISYVLRHYTDYFDSRNLSDTEYRFTFSIDKFKEDKYKKETNSGTILTSDDTIFIIMSNDESDESIESFLDIFRKHNDTNETFLEYLEKNQGVLARVERKLESNKEKVKQAMRKVPEDVKKFASDFWNAWITLDTKKLQQYYGDQVWFLAEGEFLAEFGMSIDKRRFVEVSKSNLVQAYKNVKSEDHEFLRDAEAMRALTGSIELYPAEDFMKACYAEDKDAFFTHFKIASGDTIMLVRLDNSVNCTVDGNFFGGEVRFWVIRNVDGNSKIVTDFTE